MIRRLFRRLSHWDTDAGEFVKGLLVWLCCYLVGLPLCYLWATYIAR